MEIILIALLALAYPFILIFGVIFFMWIGLIISAGSTWLFTGDDTWWKDLWI